MAEQKRNRQHIRLHLYDEDIDVTVDSEEEEYYRAAATLITEPTPLLPVSEQQKDTLQVKLDPVSNLLIVSGYTATDYIIPIVGREGNYHSREIWLYRNQLRENMLLRANAFLKKQ